MAGRLVIRGLACGRGGRLVVPPLDLTLSAGEAVLVTGENGAGKSTLLRTLAGLLPPLAGGVRVEDLPAADGEPARSLADIAHYIGHRNALKGGRHVGAELAFWARFLGRAGASRPKPRWPNSACRRAWPGCAAPIFRRGRRGARRSPGFWSPIARSGFWTSRPMRWTRRRRRALPRFAGTISQAGA